MVITDRRNIVIIGCGPGSREHLTEAARQAMLNADVLIGAGHLIDSLAPPNKECIRFGTDVDEALQNISDRLTHGRVAVLVSGDPGISSLAASVIRRFGRENCEVVPGISSIQMAFARIGIDWLDARILDAHGSIPGTSFNELIGCGKLAILAGHRDSAAWIAELGLALGEGYTAFICEDLALPSERIRRLKSCNMRDAGVTGKAVILYIREDLLQ
ncbi:MAG: precorrin-6y C5,15-methyltransferase (decarboxylating) subunit CbiE [Spirochaetes bacterium RBG_16_49_21]|nr:MAG: precorrin-6y C5,15-methyltransferase (decarboxylating) subunit CbiE [Spirochaetes bacterium RBG_16_49_21]